MLDVLAQLKQLVGLRRRRLEHAVEQVRRARAVLDECVGRKMQCESERVHLDQKLHDQRCLKVQQAPDNPHTWGLLLSQEAALDYQIENLKLHAVQLQQDVEAAREKLQEAIARQAQMQRKLQALENRVSELKAQQKQAQGQKEQRRMDELVTSLSQGKPLYD